MDLTTDDKILQGVRELVWSNILPRITQLEEEVRKLRIATWPICQSLREKSQISDIENKKLFFSILDEDEVRLLLQEKALISTRPVEFSSTYLMNEEVSLLLH